MYSLHVSDALTITSTAVRIVETKARICICPIVSVLVRSETKITISNPEKILYPAAKFTKADVIELRIVASRDLRRFT
jgi:hypothetical protein